MTKSQIFKNKFPEFKGETKEILDFIDVPNNRVNYTYYYREACGCCHGRDEDIETLEFIDDMSDGEFEELCKDVEKLTKD